MHTAMIKAKNVFFALIEWAQKKQLLYFKELKSALQRFIATRDTHAR